MVNFIKYLSEKFIIIFLISLVLSSFLEIIRAVEFPFGEELIYKSTNTLPEQDYYLNTRIPIIFYYRNMRNFMYDEFHTRFKKEIEDEDLSNISEIIYRDRCSIKIFHFLREISLNINKHTLLSWDNCYALESEKKKLLLNGKESLIQNLENERIENWRKYVNEEIDATKELPIPELENISIPSEIQSDVNLYHKYLLIYLYNGIYSGLVLEEITRKYSESFESINSRKIDNFYKIIYQENLLIDEKKKLIKKEINLLKKDIFLYQYKMMQVSVLRYFPAKTQLDENNLVLSKIKIAVEKLNIQLEKFKILKEKINNTVTCLENWPSWHKKNLRMAYYYNFFYDYGNPIKYSTDILKEPEYRKIIESLDERKYKSQIFQNRLNIMMNDACSTAEKTEEFIQLTYKPK